jgi:adenylate cyclase
VPIEAFGRLIGVLFADSHEDLRFDYDEEDALVALAGQLGTAIHVLQQAEGLEEPAAPGPAEAAAARGPTCAEPLQVRHFAENDSVFLGEDYLIKGVAGAIFWALAQDHVSAGRTLFSNRELRLDPRIRLPDLADNLEARLILLQKRLDERDAGVRLAKAGRGRFRLEVSRPLQLASVGAAR